jgi:hypothetical protein
MFLTKREICFIFACSVLFDLSGLKSIFITEACSYQKSSVFWDLMPCSLLKVTGRLGGTCHLHVQQREAGSKQSKLATCFTVVSFLAYSWTLKMEAICSSETSFDFQRTIRRYISEDRTLIIISVSTSASRLLFDSKGC